MQATPARISTLTWTPGTPGHMLSFCKSPANEASALHVTGGDSEAQGPKARGLGSLTRKIPRQTAAPAVFTDTVSRGLFLK